ncbi:MAG TPA: aldo/keto reductase [Lacipirellulaceae bacterium]|nr:aldo/keto reductase [Lacipirellulaceae bacterium]
MNEIDRRRFLGSAAGVAAVFGATGRLSAAAPAEKTPADASASERPPAPPMIELGKTGIRMSRLGQGTGVHGGNRQSNQTRLGFAKLVDLMHHAYDRGIRFFDLADLYGTHIYFREALKEMDRSQLTILTKLWWRYDGPENQTKLPYRRQMARTTLERFHDELTTYPDIVLLHCLTKPDWDKHMGPYMDVLHDAKAKKQIKAVGCSCHNLDAMKTAAASPWIDVMLARINMKGGDKFMMDGTRQQVEDVLRAARANGKAIIGMKIFGEGRLVHERDACIRYAQGNGLLDAMTIGFETPAQIDDVLRLMHKHPAKAVG